MSAIAPWTDWFTPWRFAAILGLLIVANFFTVLFGSETFFLRDFGYFSYPLAHYHRDCFWRGELPLWSPYNSCGMPYLAQWNTLTLYPPSLIYLLLPLPWSLNLFCVLHLFAGGLGMYFLAHRWTRNRFAASVAGLLFVFNGFMLNCLMWPNNIAALGLMPWVVLAVQRGWQQGGRKVLVAALVGGVQMLAGAPEVILLTWLTLAGLYLVDLFTGQCRATRSLARAGLIVLLVAGLAAAQLLPFLDLMRASNRDLTAASNSWSMPSWGWANFFVPLFHSYRAPMGTYFQPGQDWIASYYTGVCGVVLAGIGVWRARRARVWFIAALAVLGLALAFGENGFAYPMLRRVLPQLGLMRFPVKLLILVNFALPLLAATSVVALLDIRWPRRTRALLITTGAAIAVITGLVWFAHSHLARSENWQVTFWNGTSRIACLAVVAAVLCALNRFVREKSLRICSSLALLVLFLDGVTHSPRATPSIPSAALDPGVVKLTPAPTLEGNRAMLIRPAHDEIYGTMISDPLQDFLLHRQALFGNANLIDRVPTPDGFYSLYLKEQREVWSQLWFGQTNYAVSPLLDFLSVAHVNTKAIFEWTNRPSAQPVATIGQRPVFADAQQTLAALLSPEFDPKRIVYLPLEAKSRVPVTATAEASIVSAQFKAHRIELNVNASADTLLVLAQSYYSSWRAFADGKPVSILRANHAFQAIPVAAGSHQILIEYHDKSFVKGAFISLSAALMLALLSLANPKWL